jgi:hypothetical protein
LHHHRHVTIEALIDRSPLIGQPKKFLIHHLIAAWGAVQISRSAEQPAAWPMDEARSDSTSGRAPRQQLVTTGPPFPSLFACRRAIWILINSAEQSSLVSLITYFHQHLFT